MYKEMLVKGLVNVYDIKGEPSISMKEIHKCLGLSKEYYAWAAQKMELLDLITGIHYTEITYKTKKGRTAKDHFVSIETAIAIAGTSRAYEKREKLEAYLRDTMERFESGSLMMVSTPEEVEVIPAAEITIENKDIFNVVHKDFGTVETTIVDGKVLFKASDVLNALGYSKGSFRAITNRKCKSVTKCNVPHPQNHAKTLSVNFIDQFDIIRLAMTSQLPSADMFEKWLVEDVVPSVLKNGFYMTTNTVEDMLNDPDTAIKILEEYKREREQKEQLMREKEENLPKVMAYDDFINSNGTYSFASAAKILSIPRTANSDKIIGRNTLLAWMRRDSILINKGEERNTPYQRYINQGLFEVKTIDGEDYVTANSRICTRVTAKGIEYLYKKYRYSNMPKSIEVREDIDKAM